MQACSSLICVVHASCLGWIWGVPSCFVSFPAVTSCIRFHFLSPRCIEVLPLSPPDSEGKTIPSPLTPYKGSEVKAIIFYQPSVFSNSFHADPVERCPSLRPLWPPLTARRLWSIELCSAVCHCHSLRILHRDSGNMPSL